MNKYIPETVIFNSGIFDVYECDKYGGRGRLLSCGNRYGAQTIGSTRHFAAAAAQVKVTDLIRIPAGVEVNESDIIVIEGCNYSIKQIQNIFDGKPPHKLLTLNKERE